MPAASYERCGNIKKLQIQETSGFVLTGNLEIETARTDTETSRQAIPCQLWRSSMPASDPHLTDGSYHLSFEDAHERGHNLARRRFASRGPAFCRPTLGAIQVSPAKQRKVDADIFETG